MKIIIIILLKMNKIWEMLSYSKQHIVNGIPTKLETTNIKSFADRTAKMKMDINVNKINSLTIFLILFQYI